VLGEGTRLYLASLAGLHVPTATTYFISLRKMRYMPFCADFGPFNQGKSLESGKL
jgi:hypothetical protein